MLLATYNLNGVKARLPNLLEYLEDRRPDVVCLQELKTTGDQFPLAALEKAGYGAVWRGQKAWNGVALLARGTTPVETRRALPADPIPDQARYIEAAVEGVLVGCLYAPNGNPVPGYRYQNKQAWYDAFIAHAAWLMSTGHPVVLAGDFNIMPTDLDVYVPDRWRDDALFQPCLKDGYVHLLAQGWTDTLRAANPERRVYTFWKYLRNAYARDAGLRIDHILTSPALTPRVRAVGVDREVRGRQNASDHAPVWVEID